MRCIGSDPGSLECRFCPMRAAGQAETCSARWFFHNFGDKWTFPVLGRLYGEPMRFSQLRKALAPISERMLILTLKNVGLNGLIEHSVLDGSEGKGLYRLTPLGRSLVEQMRGLQEWMATHGAVVLQAMQSSEASQEKLRVKQRA